MAEKDEQSKKQPIGSDPEREQRILDKLDSVVESLKEYPTYSQDDLDKLYNDVREIHKEMDALTEKYHALDKTDFEFMTKLTQLEDSIEDFKNSESDSDEKVRSAVSAFMALLLGGAITYIFGQLKQW